MAQTRTFNTRTAITNWLLANNPNNGDIFVLGPRRWKFSSTAVDSDQCGTGYLPGLIPVGNEIYSDQFINAARYRQWSMDNQKEIINAADERERTYGGAPDTFNNTLADLSLHSVSHSVKHSTNSLNVPVGADRPYNTTTQVIVEDPDGQGDHCAGLFRATTMVGDSTRRFSAIGGYGLGVITSADAATNLEGECWGWYASAQFTQPNNYLDPTTDPTSDGMLVGLEVGAKNWGGCANDTPWLDGIAAGPYRDLAEKRKINMWFASGADSDVATATRPNTAMMVSGNPSSDGGWFYGMALRGVRYDYLYFDHPLTPAYPGTTLEAGEISHLIGQAGVRAMHVKNDQTNMSLGTSLWAQDAILLPYGTGVYNYNSDGSAVTALIKHTGTGAEVEDELTVSGHFATMRLSSPNTPASNGKIARLFYDGMNSADASVTYAAVESRITDPTAAAETGVLTLSTRVAGAFVEQARVGNGLAVGGTSTRGQGTVNATDSYYVANTKVLGAQGAAIADAVSGTGVATINSILAALRAHGIIAT